MAADKFLVAATSAPSLPVRVDIVRQVLAGLAKVDDVEIPIHTLSPGEEKEYGRRLSPYDALVTRSGVFGAGLLQRLPALKIIAIHGTGIDYIDLQTAARQGIVVTNTPGGNAIAVAELTLGLLLDVARRISRANAHIRNHGEWEASIHLGVQLQGRKLGLLGFGRIAREVALRAHAFGMQVLAYDPYVATREMIDSGVEPCHSAGDLLRAAQAVCLHMPLTSETHHFMNAQRLKSMRSGAILINAARGPLIDERALFNALQCGRLGGAGLDVLELEPADPDNPLLSLDSVVVTPHMGGSTREALENIARMAAEQIRMALSGEKPSLAIELPKV